MTYRKDQGRYVRMGAFWGLFILAGYGCLSSLVRTLSRWLPSITGSDKTVEPWIQHFPLLGQLGLPEVISLLVLSAAGVWIYSILSRPRVADLLIDTENELKKVTWPSSTETVNGTVAVGLTVVALFFFLSAADSLIAFLMDAALKHRGS